MPNNQDRGTRDFSKFDDMETEELEQILWSDAQNTEGTESDLEMTLYVMKVLAARREKSDSTGKSAAEAFESFKKNYMPHDDSEDTEEAKSELDVVETSNPRRRLRRLSAVAAVLAVVVVCSVTASAFGFDLVETIAKWTQETFHFGSPSQNEEATRAGYDTSLQERLIEYGVSVPVAPTWFPEGYKLIDVTITETPMRETYLAFYENDENKIKIQIKGYIDEDPQQVERSDSLVEIYEHNEISYYIFSNYEQLRAVWVHEKYECIIAGELTIEEIKGIIDSIE